MNAVGKDLEAAEPMPLDIDMDAATMRDVLIAAGDRQMVKEAIGLLHSDEYQLIRTELKVALGFGQQNAVDKLHEAERRRVLSARRKARIDAAGKRFLDPDQPRDLAEQFLDERGKQSKGALRRHKRQFYEWRGTHYVAHESDELVYAALSEFMADNDLDVLPKYHSGPRDQVKLLTAAEGAGIDLNTWLDGRGGEWMPFANGILDLDTGKLNPSSPEFFNTWALPYAFDPKASVSRWLTFLAEVYQDDAECIEALQRVFGWLLTRRQLQQAIVHLIGLRRSGKGTIGRIMGAMLGQDAVTATTLHDLGSGFGRQNMIGKRAAILSEARVGNSKLANYGAAQEHLLSISGEDMQSIPRKNIGNWDGILETRLIIMANEIPWNLDATGAYAARTKIIPHRVSFEGREDPSLTQTLLAELPGIFNWALEGLAKVRVDGLTQPTKGMRDVGEMRDLQNPIGQFLKERCVIEVGAIVPKEQMRYALETWWREQHLRIDTPPESRLTIQLRAASNELIQAGRRRIEGMRVPKIRGGGVVKGNPLARVYEGVRLRTESDDI